MNIHDIINEFKLYLNNNFKNNNAELYLWAIELFEDYLAHYSSLNHTKSEYASGDNIILDDIQTLSSKEIEEFLHVFVIKYVACDNNELKTIVHLLQIFMDWLKKNKYISNEKHKNLLISVGNAEKLPDTALIADYLFKIAEENQTFEATEVTQGVFKVISKEKHVIIIQNLTETNNTYNIEINDIIVEKIAKGIILNLAIGKYKGKWLVIHAGNVYLKDIRDTEI